MVAALLVGSGLLVQGVGLVAGGWPTYTGLLLAGWAAPFLILGIWARKRGGRPGAPWLARNASLIGVPLLLGGIAADRALTGVESRVVLPMTWQIEQAADGPEVVLRFRDAPDHHVGLVSEDVAEYLEARGDAGVPVEFVVTRDYGRLRGYRIARIGELERMRMGRGYGGCRGDCRGSPF